MDCSLPASSVHWIFQARILEWVAISFSRESSWFRVRTWVFSLASRFFATEPPGKPLCYLPSFRFCFSMEYWLGTNEKIKIMCLFCKLHLTCFILKFPKAGGLLYRVLWTLHPAPTGVASYTARLQYQNQYIDTGRTGAEAETPVLWPPDANNWLVGKDPDAGKDWGQEEKGMTEDEMVGWHHWLNGHEFEQIPGVGDGQGSLVCCSPWGRKELDTTEWLNWSEALNSIPRPSSSLRCFFFYKQRATPTPYYSR